MKYILRLITKRSLSPEEAANLVTLDFNDIDELTNCILRLEYDAPVSNITGYTIDKIPDNDGLREPDKKLDVECCYTCKYYQSKGFLSKCGNCEQLSEYERKE